MELFLEPQIKRKRLIKGFQNKFIHKYHTQTSYGTPKNYDMNKLFLNMLLYRIFLTIQSNIRLIKKLTTLIWSLVIIFVAVPKIKKSIQLILESADSVMILNCQMIIIFKFYSVNIFYDYRV